ncbi:MAG TPA: hypothetical protein VMR59_04700 [Patescibacteria group bacterium]|jgi:hypothetical protein|nr:hypothetical protein [Patescibacteria group bacterium]
MTEPIDASRGVPAPVEPTGEQPQIPQEDRYIFNPAEFDEKAAAELRRHEEWLRTEGWREDRARETLDRQRQDLAENRTWCEAYSGKVKREWGWGEVNENAGYPSWAHIITDIEDQGVPLTAVEIDAAIDYPLWHVPVSLGENRPLTQEQLDRLATKKNMVRAKTFEKDIADAQLRMGVEPQVVQHAVGLNQAAGRVV